MKIQDTINIVASLRNVMWDRLKQLYEQLARVINGGVEFGSPTGGPVNVSGVWDSRTTPPVPNTDFIVTHNLGRVCVGYVIMTKDQGCDIYTSPTLNLTPLTQIILRCDTAGVNITLFLI